MARNDFSMHSGYFIQEIARRTNYLLNGKLSSLGITYSQFRVLNCLWRKGDMTQREIHEIIEVKPSTLTGLIDLLAGKEFIERYANEEDARSNRIRLTNRGVRLQKPAREIIEAFEKRMTEGIGEGERQMLIRNLKCINSNLR